MTEPNDPHEMTTASVSVLLERIEAGVVTDADRSTLRQLLLAEPQRLTQLGKYNIQIGEGQHIQIGDRTYVDINDAALQAIVAAIQKSIPLSPQTQQTVSGNQNQVIGNVTGGTVIAAVQGDVHIHPPENKSLPVGIPQNLPRTGAVAFVGREPELEELHQLFQQTGQITPVAIVGMGGIGKTELALQYASKYQAEYPGGTCWLQARGIDLGAQIVSYAKAQLKLTPPDDLDLPGQVAFCWRQWLEGDVLVVFDDVIDYQVVKLYLPPSQVRFKVLLTSRMRTGKSLHQLTLDLLKEESALNLLSVLIGQERLQTELDPAKILCNWLGYLPLGLEIVGRYLDQKADLSLTKMLQRLENKRLASPAVCNVEDDMTAKLGVAAAFELSWDTLPVAARELGCLLGLFATAPIPWILVEQCEPDEDSEELEDLRDEKLLKLNLLQRTEKDTYRLHPLMREFFQMKLPQCTNGEGLKSKFCTQMVEVTKTIPLVLTRSDVIKFTPIIPHIAEAATAQSEYIKNTDLMLPYEKLGRFYESQGFYNQAEPWYHLGSQTIETHLAKDPIQVAYSLSQLARIFRYQGRYSESECLYTKILDIRQQRCKNTDPALAETLNEMALLREGQGQYSEAETLYLKALEMRHQIFGNDHADVAESMSNLALFYNEHERYSEAEPLLIEALDLRKRLLGNNHPFVADSMSNLAACFSSQKRYSEAETLYLEAIALLEQLVGESHPDVATALNNLAYLYISQERYSEAEPLFLMSLDILKLVHGDEHPNVAINLDNLASLYDMQGRSLDAESLYLQVIDMRERLLGANHPYVAFSLNNLAKLYYLQKRYAEAEPLYIKAVGILEEQLGTDHPITVKVSNNLQDLLSAKAAK